MSVCYNPKGDRHSRPMWLVPDLSAFPTKATPVELEGLPITVRNYACADYDRCLCQVAEDFLPAWSCAGCPRIDEVAPEWDQLRMDDIFGSWRILRAVFPRVWPRRSGGKPG